MNRRDFLKLAMAAGCSCFIPALSGRAFAAPLDDIVFDPAVYSANEAQTIMVFLYGGASELGGNFTNYDEFKELSESSYADYFGSTNVVPTINGFWGEAGGDLMEELMVTQDLNVFRTCFSQVRWDNENRSHGSCVNQNQRGTFNEDAAGIFANLARVLYSNGIITTDTTMPFISMDGESAFYIRGNLPMVPVLEPFTISANLDNPFERGWARSYSDQMDILAQDRNRLLDLSPKITDAFDKRAELDQFITSILTIPDPQLGTNGAGEDLNYENNDFAKKMKNAVKIFNSNNDTRVISLSTSGLGGWDDHNDADNYLARMKQLFRALRSAVTHIKQLGKDDTINIMIMGDFGRGVNLNSAKGWDHGNLQSFYVLGGKRYFQTPGVVGETVLDATGNANRLFLRPAGGSPWFEPSSIAATIYAVYGITNPEILTDGNVVISQLLR